jgi:hypothetical protein
MTEMKNFIEGFTADSIKWLDESMSLKTHHLKLPIRRSTTTKIENEKE